MNTLTGGFKAPFSINSGSDNGSTATTGLTNNLNASNSLNPFANKEATANGANIASDH